ncbi:MAG TPA: wax ester/triacylglycerol synthase domain-containing protein [Nakamurella sp.]
MTAPRITRLSADDMIQLAQEASGARMQFAAVAVLDGAPGLGDLRGLIESRLGAVPRLRQRLVRVPYGRPIWVDDPDFDIGRQIDELPCRSPGDRPALLAAVADIIERRMTLTRPPWRITLVRGLSGGRAALVIVLHHVLADGLAGLAVLSRLVDGGGAGGRPRTARWPTAAEVRADARAEHRRRIAASPGLPGRLRAAAAELLRGGTGTAPRCSINAGPVGQRRALAVAQVDLAAVAATARLVGGTVNDVVLTAVTAALACVLAGQGERLERLIVSVPISARRRADTVELGNRVGVLPVSLPLAGPTGERLAAVAAVTRSRKTETPGASTALLGPFVRALAAIGVFGAFIGHQRLVNTFVTNVRGPREPLSLGGCRIAELIPVSAISGNVGVAFAVLSYAGRLTVTVVADPDRCPDLERLAGLLQAQLDDLAAPARPELIMG